jgi:hypothetical protein
MNSDGRTTLAVTQRLLWLGGMRRELLSHIFVCPGAVAKFPVAQGLSVIRFLYHSGRWLMQRVNRTSPHSDEAKELLMGWSQVSGWLR